MKVECRRGEEKEGEEEGVDFPIAINYDNDVKFYPLRREDVGEIKKRTRKGKIQGPGN